MEELVLKMKDNASEWYKKNQEDICHWNFVNICSNLHMVVDCILAEASNYTNLGIIIANNC